MAPAPALFEMKITWFAAVPFASSSPGASRTSGSESVISPPEQRSEVRGTEQAPVKQLRVAHLATDQRLERGLVAECVEVAVLLRHLPKALPQVDRLA